MGNMCMVCGYMFSRGEKKRCPNCNPEFKSETQKIKELNLLLTQKEEEIAILKYKLAEARLTK